MTKREIKIRVLRLLASQASKVCAGDKDFWIAGSAKQRALHEAKVGWIIDEIASELDAKADRLRESETRCIARRGL